MSSNQEDSTNEEVGGVGRAPGAGMTASLSAEERVNARKALLFLAERSTPAQLAEALGITPAALEKARTPSRIMGRRLAIRVARAAEVSLEDVLSGAWPGNACPRCGRSSGGAAQYDAGLAVSVDSSSTATDELSRDLTTQQPAESKDSPPAAERLGMAPVLGRPKPRCRRERATSGDST